MSNIIPFPQRQPPDGDLSPTIRIIYLASPATATVASGLRRLGFTEYENNTWANTPKDINREEFQAHLNQQTRPLIPVEDGDLVSLEEGLVWLEE